MLRVVFVTCPPKHAEPLARRLLAERLIACASLVPRLRSLYWWKGKLESATETLLILKTPARRVPRLLRRVQELHPYEVPEIIVLPVVAGHRPYLEWAKAETRRVR